MLGVGDPRGRVVLELRRRRLAAQRGDDAGEDDDDAVAAGVDDARPRAGPAAARARGAPTPRRRRSPPRGCRPARAAARRPRRRARAAARHVGQARRDVRRHVAHDGQHRALGRRADRGVGALGRARHGGAQEHRVDELARARDELLGRAADELGEDDAAVAARAEQRGAGHRLDDLLAADLVERPVDGGEPVDLLQARVQGQRHVVARVAVGDREDVEVVDLLPARLEVRECALDAARKRTRLGSDTPEAARRVRRPW